MRILIVIKSFASLLGKNGERESKHTNNSTFTPPRVRFTRLISLCSGSETSKVKKILLTRKRVSGSTLSRGV